MKSLLYFILTKSIGLFINILQWFSPKTAAKTAYYFFSHPRVKRFSKNHLPPILQSAEKQIFDYGKFIKFVSEKFYPQFVIAHSLGGASAVYSQAIFPSVSLQKMVLIAAPSDQKVLFENYVKLLGLRNSVLVGIDAHFKRLFGYSLDEFSARNFAKLITIPTMIIHDHTDTSVLYEESQKIFSNLPNSIMHSSNGLDHSMQDDDLNMLIYDFIFK